jgi:hypothetical protein
MQYALACAQTMVHELDRLKPPDSTTLAWQRLWHALWDLATEVEHYEPAEPPYGQRLVGRRVRPS